MGRIIVFSLSDCPHCLRSKKYLESRKVPYIEISLTSHPSKRSDMLSLADRLTVPQFFFNTTHIGGANDLIAKVDEIESTSDNNFLEYFEREIASHPDPTDERLQIPNTPPVTIHPPPPRENEKSVTMPDGTMVSVLDATLQFIDILPKDDLKYRGTIYKKSFTGTAAVRAFMKNYKDNLTTEEEAIQFGNELLREHKIIKHVVDEHNDFKNTPDLYYRLQCYDTPSILNSFRIWTERIDTDSMALLKRLKKLLGKVETEITDDTTGLVNYSKASSNKNYKIFEEAICELQGVNMETMEEKMRLAFGINLYNVMIKYAFMKVGIGNTASSRNAFFSSVTFNVGGDVLSFNDLEHGILRGNKRPAYGLTTQLNAKTDDRARLALTQPDCRIHFALNCGAKSCPPVKNFTASDIDEELRIVALSFAEQDENVYVNEEENKLRLTKILSWFRSDFAPSNKELPQKVIEFLRGEKKAKLQRMIDNKQQIKIEFNDYDWGTNANEFIPFDSNSLKANSKSIINFF